MKSFLIGVCIAACLVPIDAYGSCRKRFRVKQVVVKQVVQQLVQPIYVQPAIYASPAPVQVQAAALQPIYQQQVQQVAAVCCCPCPTIQGAAPPPAPLPGQPAGGPLSPPPAGSDVPAADASDQEIQALFTKTCVACHDGNNPKTSLVLTDLTKLSREQRQSTSIRVMLGEMPPGRPEAVSDQEAQALLKWSDRK